MKACVVSPPRDADALWCERLDFWVRKSGSRRTAYAVWPDAFCGDGFRQKEDRATLHRFWKFLFRGDGRTAGIAGRAAAHLTGTLPVQFATRSAIAARHHRLSYTGRSAGIGVWRAMGTGMRQCLVRHKRARHAKHDGEHKGERSNSRHGGYPARAKPGLWPNATLRVQVPLVRPREDCGLSQRRKLLESL